MAEFFQQVVAGLASGSVSCSSCAVEPVAWAFRQVTSATAAAPSKKTVTDANLDRDMTAGTAQSQARMLSAVANTRRPTKRNIGESTRITLSAGMSAGRRADT